MRPPRRLAGLFAVPILAVTVLALVLAVLRPAAACGPYFIDARFWPQESAGVPWQRLVDGDLGILDVGQDRLTGYVAYRHLAGPALSADDRAALLRSFASETVPDDFDSPRPDPQERWLAARAAIPGTPEVSWFSTVLYVEERDGDDVRYLSVANCLPDAFRTATATLEARVATWGADSPQVAEWLCGQDQVFSNCAGGGETPEPLDDSWPPQLRRDRDYQRAAALFYARDYAAAEDAFRAVAGDAASPWRQTARFLVPRCRARAGRYEEAAAMMRQLLVDPAMQPFHDSARGLVDHYQAQYEPAERHREVRDRLLAEPLPPTLRQDWIDYRWAYPDGFDDASLDRWLLVLSARDDEEDEDDEAIEDRAVDGDEASGTAAAAATALGLWRSIGNRLWLDAALITAGGATERGDLEDLLAASAGDGDGADSPAGDAKTRAYHRARLFTLLGRCAEARREIPLPAPGLPAAAPSLSFAESNRFRVLRAECAENLKAFLRDSQLQPWDLGFDDGGSGWLSVDQPPPPVLLSDRALEVLDGLSVVELAQLTQGDLLAAGPRAEVARAAWTRAAVLGDHAAAGALAPRLGELQPELAKDLKAYAAAGPEPAAADFAAAFLILRYPGLHPDLHRELNRPDSLAEIDSLRQNWWCEGAYLGPFVAPPDARHAFPPPPFLAPDTESQRRPGAARAEQRAALQELPVAAVGLGATVLTWADTHRDDPRVPEALHRLVRATRYGCYNPEGYGPVSRAAFELLHRRYPDSPWAAKTPYWFE